jgi:16S rRNA (guanine527-N7)-methyltransferase
MLDFSIRYLNVLKTKFAGLNLTKILDPDEFYHKQILDSINPYLQSDFFKQQVLEKKIVIDVGFGGGFPILPLAKLLPEVRFVGVETRKKKAEAVSVIAQDLGLKNVTLVHARIEEFFIDRSAVITFKAVGTVADFLPRINANNQNISVFFYKGPNFLDLEGESIKNLSSSWKMHGVEEINVPGTEKRFLASFVAQNVPRGTSKTLVKLSDFL